MSDSSAQRPLLDRFPALRALRRTRRRAIPYIQGMQSADCGAACLAMVLAYHGKHVSLDAVRQFTGTGRDGTNAQSMINAARRYGLRGRGVRVDVDVVEHLPKGSILHWDLDHFVVFEGLRRNNVDIVDPQYGRRRVHLEQFRKSFTGVALMFEPADTFRPQRRDVDPVWHYFKKVLSHTNLLFRIIVTSLFAQCIVLALPILTAVLVDTVIPRGDYTLLLVLGLGLLLMCVFNSLSTILRAHLLLHLGTHLSARMTLDFLDHLVSLPYDYFQRRSAGDLNMRLNSNNQIRDTLTTATLSALIDGGFVCLYLILLVVVSPAMGFLAIALGAAQLLMFASTCRRYKELMTDALQVQAKAQSYQVEVLAGIETLKAAGAEHRAIERWSHLFTDVLNATLKRGRLAATVEPLMATVATLSNLMLLGFGGYLVMTGSLTLGTMLALSALAVNFLTPLGSLVNTALQIQLLRPHIERIRDVFDSQPEQKPTQGLRAAPLGGRVKVERVSFQYGPFAPMVIQDVSLQIHPGQQLAIVGRTGSGKSTLASLLLGLYRPTSGRILYDDVDLDALDVRSVRSQLGIVTQHPYLFAASIRENIILNDPSIPVDAVVRALQLAHIYDEVTAMPMGYDTILADAGATLSGGQRQRLALARALVHKPAVLLLDEATSALDAVTERKIQRELDALNCTRIIIAQRLSTIVNADVIVVLEAGQIVERGTHDELLSLRGRYTELVSGQTGERSRDEK